MEMKASLHGFDSECVDSIYLGNYRYDAVVGLDCWGRKKAQQIITSIRITFDVTIAGQTDDIGQTLNYGQVAKALAKSVKDREEYGGFAELNEELVHAVQCMKQVQVHVKSIAPKGLLRGGFGCESWYGLGQQEVVTVFDSLRLWLIVGVNDHERLAKQLVMVNLRIKENAAASDSEYSRSIVERAMNVCQAPSDCH